LGFDNLPSPTPDVKSGWLEGGREDMQKKMHPISKIRSYAVSGIHEGWDLTGSSTYGTEV